MENKRPLVFFKELQIKFPDSISRISYAENKMNYLGKMILSDGLRYQVWAGFYKNRRAKVFVAQKSINYFEEFNLIDIC